MTRLLAALICAATWQLAGRGLAQTPELELALTAVAPGRTVAIGFAGDGLGFARTLWASFPAETRLDPQTKPRSDRATFLVTVPPDGPTGIGVVRLGSSNRFSGPVLVLVDALPSVPSAGGHRTLATAQRVNLPVAVDGACAELGSDFFVFAARAGQRVSVDVVAQRLGSALDPWLRLLDARGRELAFNEDSPGAGADARLSHLVPADGDYVIQLRDSRYQGGAAHRYRLRLGDFPLAPLPFLHDAARFPPADEHGLKPQHESEPNDSAEIATRLELPALISGNFQKPGDSDFFQFTLAKPGRWLVLGRTRSRGYACDLLLTLLDGKGGTIATSQPTGADEGIITNAFTKAGSYRLRVEELSRLGGPELSYQVALQPYTGFALSVDADKFEAPSGGSLKLKVTCARRDFDGAITLALTGDAREFSVTNHIIAAKKTETTLRVTVPATLAPGTLLHFQIHGIAKAKDGDTAMSAAAQTLGALHKALPNLPHPPAALDGTIALGVLPPESKAGGK